MQYGFHPDNPKLRPDGNKGLITYSNVIERTPEGEADVYGLFTAELVGKSFNVKTMKHMSRQLATLTTSSENLWWVVDFYRRPTMTLRMNIGGMGKKKPTVDM